VDAGFFFWQFFATWRFFLKARVANCPNEILKKKNPKVAIFLGKKVNIAIFGA
jgi:hypothetical protein